MADDTFDRKIFPTNKPWNAIDVPSEIYFPRGMLGEEERRMLYWLSSVFFQGEGVIVDAGAYAGASAFCLASGSSRSRFADIPFARILSYDLFKALDAYVAEAVSKDFHKIEIGGDYADVFRYQTALYADRIDMFQGDFLTAPVPNNPIEILFVDVAKTSKLNEHLTLSYVSKMIPGRSIIVQQDYYHCWHPYMQITMEALSDYFELLDPLVTNQSRLWRLARPIPKEALTAAADPNMRTEEAVRYLDRAIAKDAGITREMNRVTRLWYLVSHDHITEAQAYSESLPPAAINSAELWQRQLAAVRKELDRRRELHRKKEQDRKKAV